ncbi:MAG: hypothetical protein AOA65_2275 [Candidatus Bathyarchaeota archaeon BA1]|nr:MAG: hypothetical protein AOA65_2275 [Candidatus Bathyarchaeota archaeon BA1]
MMELFVQGKGNTIHVCSARRMASSISSVGRVMVSLLKSTTLNTNTTQEVGQNGEASKDLNLCRSGRKLCHKWNSTLKHFAELKDK